MSLRPAGCSRAPVPPEQKRTVFEKPARVGLQPPLKDGFLMVGLERHRFVLRERLARC